MGRGDVAPVAAVQIQPPDRSVGHPVGPDAPGPGGVEHAARVDHALDRRQAVRPAVQPPPGLAAVVRAIEALRPLVRHPRQHDRAALPRPAGTGVEQDEADPRIGGLALGRDAEPRVRKTLNPSPGLAMIAAALKTVMARSEIEHRRVVGIDRQPFAQPPPVLIAPHGKIHRMGDPGLAPVRRAQDGGPAAPVHAHRRIDHVRIDRIEGDALHTVEAGFRLVVLQRNPAVLRRVEAIDAAHVRAGPGQARLQRAEHDAGNEAAAAHFHIAPDIVRILRRRRDRPQEGQKQNDLQTCRHGGPSPGRQLAVAVPAFSRDSDSANGITVDTIATYASSLHW